MPRLTSSTRSDPATGPVEESVSPVSGRMPRRSRRIPTDTTATENTPRKKPIVEVEIRRPRRVGRPPKWLKDAVPSDGRVSHVFERKNMTKTPTQANADDTLVTPKPRGRGRPRKIQSELPALHGRKSTVSHQLSSKAHTTPRQKKPGARPVGRPRKYPKVTNDDAHIDQLNEGKRVGKMPNATPVSTGRRTRGRVVGGAKASHQVMLSRPMSATIGSSFLGRRCGKRARIYSNTDSEVMLSDGRSLIDGYAGLDTPDDPMETDDDHTGGQGVLGSPSLRLSRPRKKPRITSMDADTLLALFTSQKGRRRGRPPKKKYPLRESAIQERKKLLEELLDDYDRKVRELFHLEVRRNMFLYDSKALKADDSIAMQQVCVDTRQYILFLA
jgi:hypothetical protein